MRRLKGWFAIVFAVLLTGPSGASAAPANLYDYRGDVRADAQAEVGIDVERRNGERYIRDFMVDNLRQSCEGGGSIRTGTVLFGRTDIDRDGHFHKRFGDGFTAGVVRGRFGGGEVRGEVRVTGYSTLGALCESPLRQWDAERGG